jgi:glycosyltransferase involved in cell wall biosynthesis
VYVGSVSDVCILSRGEVCDEVRESALSVRQSGESLVQRLVHPLWLVYHVLLLSRKYDVEYVHTNHSPQALLAGFVLQRFGFTWVADLYDSPHFGVSLEGAPKSAGRLLARVYNRTLLSLVKLTLGSADLIVISMVPDIFTQYKIYPSDENVLHVTNGIELAETRRAISDTSSSRFTLVYVGPVRKERGIRTVFEALRRLDSSIGDVELRLVGGVRDRDEQWIEESASGLDDVVVNVLGRIPHDDALAEIDRATVALCPLSPEVENYEYSYPIKLFEYMALGKPIIASRMKGVATVLDHEKTALLVEPACAESMAAAVTELYQNPELRMELSTNASRAVEEYDWRAINRRIRNRIEHLTT